VSVVALTYLPALAICPRTTRLTGLGDETRKKKKQLRSGVRMSPMLKDTWLSPAARSAEWKRGAEDALRLHASSPDGCFLPSGSSIHVDPGPLLLGGTPIFGSVESMQPDLLELRCIRVEDTGSGSG
jgi:hypothetical protein